MLQRVEVSVFKCALKCEHWKKLNCQLKGKTLPGSPWEKVSGPNLPPAVGKWVCETGRRASSLSSSDTWSNTNQRSDIEPVTFTQTGVGYVNVLWVFCVFHQTTLQIVHSHFINDDQITSKNHFSLQFNRKNWKRTESHWNDLLSIGKLCFCYLEGGFRCVCTHSSWVHAEGFSMRCPSFSSLKSSSTGTPG